MMGRTRSQTALNGREENRVKNREAAGNAKNRSKSQNNSATSRMKRKADADPEETTSFSKQTSTRDLSLVQNGLHNKSTLPAEDPPTEEDEDTPITPMKTLRSDRNKCQFPDCQSDYQAMLPSTRYYHMIIHGSRRLHCSKCVFKAHRHADAAQHVKGKCGGKIVDKLDQGMFDEWRQLSMICYPTTAKEIQAFITKKEAKLLAGSNLQSDHGATEEMNEESRNKSNKSQRRDVQVVPEPIVAPIKNENEDWEAFLSTRPSSAKRERLPEANVSAISRPTSLLMRSCFMQQKTIEVDDGSTDTEERVDRRQIEEPPLIPIPPRSQSMNDVRRSDYPTTSGNTSLQSNDVPTLSLSLMNSRVKDENSRRIQAIQQQDSGFQIQQLSQEVVRLKAENGMLSTRVADERNQKEMLRARATDERNQKDVAQRLLGKRDIVIEMLEERILQLEAELEKIKEQFVAHRAKEIIQAENDKYHLKKVIRERVGSLGEALQTAATIDNNVPEIQEHSESRTESPATQVPFLNLIQGEVKDKRSEFMKETVVTLSVSLGEKEVVLKEGEARAPPWAQGTGHNFGYDNRYPGPPQKPPNYFRENFPQPSQYPGLSSVLPTDISQAIRLNITSQQPESSTEYQSGIDEKNDAKTLEYRRAPQPMDIDDTSENLEEDGSSHNKPQSLPSAASGIVEKLTESPKARIFSNIFEAVFCLLNLGLDRLTNNGTKKQSDCLEWEARGSGEESI
ncbi:unnamed protein product, partial [Mesorhabditis belari]|uniref:Uncharacterized protein n=1 Tax=Mesorhabditis belari TaxID=2138241 RepID=A0AAF3EVV0_9BILA